MALCISPQVSPLDCSPSYDDLSGIVSLLDSAGLKVESVNLISDNHSDTLRMELGMGQQHRTLSRRASITIVVEDTTHPEISGKENSCTSSSPSPHSSKGPGLLRTQLQPLPKSPSLPMQNCCQSSNPGCNHQQQPCLQKLPSANYISAGWLQPGNHLGPALQDRSEGETSGSRHLSQGRLQRVSSAPWDITEIDEVTTSCRRHHATLSLRPEASPPSKGSLLSWGPQLGCAVVSPPAQVEKPPRQSEPLQEERRKVQWERIQGTLRKTTESEVQDGSMSSTHLGLYWVPLLGQEDFTVKGFDATEEKIVGTNSSLEGTPALQSGQISPLPEPALPHVCQETGGVVLHRPSPWKKPQLKRSLAMKPVRVDSPKKGDFEDSQTAATEQHKDALLTLLPHSARNHLKGAVRAPLYPQSVPRCSTSPGDLQHLHTVAPVPYEPVRTVTAERSTGISRSRTTEHHNSTSPRKKLNRNIPFHSVVHHVHFTSPLDVQGLPCCSATVDSDSSSSKPGSVGSADWQETADTLLEEADVDVFDEEPSAVASRTMEEEMPAQTPIIASDGPPRLAGLVKAPASRGFSLPLSAEDIRKKSKAVKNKVKFLQSAEAAVFASDPALDFHKAGGAAAEGFSPAGGRRSFQGLLKQRLLSSRQAVSFQERVQVSSESDLWSLEPCSNSKSKASSSTLERTGSGTVHLPFKAGLLLQRDGSCSSRDDSPVNVIAVAQDHVRPMSIFARGRRGGQELRDINPPSKELTGNSRGFPRDMSWGSVGLSEDGISCKGVEVHTETEHCSQESNAGLEKDIPSASGIWGDVHEEGALWERFEEKVILQDQGIRARGKVQCRRGDIPQPRSQEIRLRRPRLSTNPQSSASACSSPSASGSGQRSMCLERRSTDGFRERQRGNPSPLGDEMDFPEKSGNSGSSQSCRVPRSVQVTFPWGEVKSVRPVASAAVHN